MRIEISSGSVFRLLFLVIGLVLLYILRDIVIIMLFAIVVASAISPFTTWLETRGIPRVLGVLVLYLVLFGLVILVVSLVVPFLSQDLAQLTTTFPQIVERVSKSLDTVQQGSPQYFDFVSEIQNILNVFSAYLQQFSQSAIGLVVSIFGGIFSFLAIVVISFYLSVMKRGIESFLEAITPDKHERYVVGLWKRSERQVGRWLQGQMLLALIVGLLVYVGLSLMGIRFALVLGLLAMALEIVPIAGPVLASIPAIFLAFLEAPVLGLWVIVLYTVIQQIESHILTPLILGRATGLNPVVVILALLVGGSLAGIAGAIIAVPLASVLVEILDDMARSKEAARSNSSA